MKRIYIIPLLFLIALLLLNSCGTIGKLSYTDGETIYLDNPRRLNNDYSLLDENIKPVPIDEDYMPVCGKDGNTYYNAYEAGQAGVSWVVGKCKKACPRVYFPVCGRNGITYGNPCEAEAAGVREYTKGRCDGKAIIHPMPCPAPKDPPVAKPLPYPAPNDPPVAQSPTKRPPAINPMPNPVQKRPVRKPSSPRPPRGKRDNIGSTRTPRR